MYPAAPEFPRQLDHHLLGRILLELLAGAADQPPAVGHAAGPPALALQVRQCGLGALADHLAFPLAHGGQQIEHHAAAGGAAVDLLADGQERGAALRAEVIVEQLAQVADRSRQPVQLRHHDRLDVALAQHRQHALQARALERLGADAGILDHRDQLEAVEAGIGLDHRPLRLEADTVARLFVRRHPQICRRAHGFSLSFRYTENSS